MEENPIVELFSSIQSKYWTNNGIIQTEVCSTHKTLRFTGDTEMGESKAKAQRELTLGP